MIVNSRGLRVDLTGAVWRKSSASGPYSDNCLEVAFVDDEAGNPVVAIRNSKAPETVALSTRAEWDAFVQGMANGEFVG